MKEKAKASAARKPKPEAASQEEAGDVATITPVAAAPAIVTEASHNSFWVTVHCTDFGFSHGRPVLTSS